MIKRSDVDWESELQTLLDLCIDETAHLLDLLSKQRYLDAAFYLGEIKQEAQSSFVRFFGADESYSLDPMKVRNND